MKANFRNASFAPHEIQCIEHACNDSVTTCQVLEGSASERKRLPGVTQDDIDPWTDYNPDTDEYDVRTAHLLPAATLQDEVTRKQILALQGRISKGGDSCVINHYLKVVGDLEALISGLGMCKEKFEIPSWRRKVGHARTPSSTSAASESTCCPHDYQDLHFALEDDVILRARLHDETKSLPADIWGTDLTFTQAQQAVSPDRNIQPAMTHSRVLPASATVATRVPTSQVITRNAASPGEDLVQPAWFTMTFSRPVQIHNDQAAKPIKTDLRLPFSPQVEESCSCATHVEGRYRSEGKRTGQSTCTTIN